MHKQIAVPDMFSFLTVKTVNSNFTFFPICILSVKKNQLHDLVQFCEACLEIYAVVLPFLFSGDHTLMNKILFWSHLEFNHSVICLEKHYFATMYVSFIEAK